VGIAYVGYTKKEMNLLLIYILGYLIVQTLCVMWFYSPLRISLGQLFFDKNLISYDEFETHMLIRSPLIGKLLSCYFCFSFWTSVGIGIAGILLLCLPLWTPFLTCLSYPSICFLYKKIID